MSDIDWNTGDKSAMVSIGSHKLYLSASGQDRQPGQPIILLMQGMASTIDEWVLVKRLVSPFARWVEYDRSGLGRSEDAVETREEISAASVAADLALLLETAGVAPPYVIVAHSWGGLTSREFIHLQGENVAGIVFVDAVTEFSTVREELVSAKPYLAALHKDVDFLPISSLTRDLKLSPEEWAAVRKQADSDRTSLVEAAELKASWGDKPVLMAKKQGENQVLGNRPVSVLAANDAMDLQTRFDAGVAAGNGTEEERAQYRVLIDRMAGEDIDHQKEQLKLSSVARYTFTATNGHNVQMTDPQLIADEIRWVLDSYIETS
ncbi:Alpha/Beta hydrolase protein [Trichoderma austrokoningii]